MLLKNNNKQPKKVHNYKKNIKYDKNSIDI